MCFRQHEKPSIEQIVPRAWSAVEFTSVRGPIEAELRQWKLAGELWQMIFVADSGTSLLVRREHAGVPQTSKQQLEEMTVGKLRRSVVRTCERNGVREHSRFKRSVPLEMGI